MSKKWVLFGCSIATALALACGNNTKTPVSPGGTTFDGDADLEGGVTLKVSAPVLVEPVGGVIVEDLDPDFVWRHSSPMYASASLPLQYDLEIYNSAGQLAYARTLPQGPGETTRHEPTQDLQDDETHTWRVRARYQSRVGPWSTPSALFKTYVPPSILPPGPYPASGGDPLGHGAAIVAFVGFYYPEYLVPTRTFAERERNMHFLRDRIIEVGRCAGMDLALNRKRSGIISDDAITWKYGPTLTPSGGGDVEVIDIALDWDNNDTPLKIHFNKTEGPAGYTPLPNPQRCR